MFQDILAVLKGRHLDGLKGQTISRAISSNDFQDNLILGRKTKKNEGVKMCKVMFQNVLEA